MTRATKLSASSIYPGQKKLQQPISSAQRDLMAVVRRDKRLALQKITDAMHEKRTAAILSGRFRRADGSFDERGLDAFAPHPCDLDKVQKMKPVLVRLTAPTLSSLKFGAPRLGRVR